MRDRVPSGDPAGTKKRVCIFCEEWGSGGIETFLLNVLSRVDRNRYALDIVATRLKSDAYSQRLKELGIELRVLPRSGPLGHMSFRAFSGALAEGRYDVAYFNLYQGLALGYVRAAERAGVPVRIVHSHNTDLRQSALRPMKLAVHDACKRLFGGCATGRLACSKAAAAFLFPESVISSGSWEMLPNGIRLERFAFDPRGRERMRRELGLTDELAVGCIGRLCYQKNQGFLLEAFAALRQSRPDVRLFLVGEGEDLEALKRKARELGVEGAVTFYGVTDRIPELLWAFDALAVPSVFEGLGIVAIEAQAAGLPVLCSDRVPQEVRVTGLVEHLPIDSAQRWASALQATAGRREGDTLPALKAAGYDIQDVAKRLEAVWSGSSTQSTIQNGERF